ncbi:hypothetical protein UFOVP111_121 [uncultured Caudovirales phage]|uniref:Glyco_tranf_GTA_type domain containing protein n=1 Tax=uncultured Caudovirales phage TaxID=2100421 RepID=A0A6J5L7D4_9CAUD|nr:hypothetical protein UFOVP111_121 [uncultured Caudovirales phage]
MELESTVDMDVNLDIVRMTTTMIATPAYGGQCGIRYATTMMNVFSVASHNNVPLLMQTIDNESLISRGRNWLAGAFIKSDADLLLFIDGDMSFDPSVVFHLIQLMIVYPEIDVLGVACPVKAVPPTFAVNVTEEVREEFYVDRPIPSKNVGTGIMMIRRSILEKITKEYPEKAYLASFTGEPLVDFFNPMVDPDTKEYLSEDYSFCRDVLAVGGSVYTVPYFTIEHSGTYVYSGNYSEYAMQQHASK